MSWGLWVHAGDVAKEGVPELLDGVANVGKACTTSDISVLDFMVAHQGYVSDSACGMLAGGSSPRWSRSICLGRIEQHWHDEGHVQRQPSCREWMWLGLNAF